MRSSAWLFGLAMAAAGCTSNGTNAFDDGGATDATTHPDALAQDAAHDALVSDDAGDDGACQLPIDTQVQACNECLQANCCDAFAACAQDSECAALHDCNVGCASGQLPNDAGPFDASADGSAQSCASACATAHAGGAAKYSAEQQCATSHCGPPADDGGGGSGACTL